MNDTFTHVIKKSQSLNISKTHKNKISHILPKINFIYIHTHINIINIELFISIYKNAKKLPFFYLLFIYYFVDCNKYRSLGFTYI